jgi:hypothetical protein
MKHPFELQVSELMALDLNLRELSAEESELIVGGKKHCPPPGLGGVTADGVGCNEVGGPFTAPNGNFENGGPTPSTKAACEEGGCATTLAVGEEGGGITTFALGEEGGHWKKKY